MVNTGQRSRGCLTCRRRHIKCDEARPSCQRCIKLQADCEWKDEWSSMIRHQESWAKKKVAQRVERVQQLRNLQDAKSGSFSSSHQYPNLVALPKQWQIGPEIYAITRFYADFSHEAATCPYLNLVQPLYVQEKTPNSLHSVVPAVALASAAKQQRRHDLMMAANQHYGKSLSRLAQSLTDHNVAKHDASLLTVFMLNLFELIAYDKSPSNISPYESHGPGRLALLRLRGPEQLATPQGRNLFIIIYHDHLAAAMMGYAEPLEESPEWIHAAFPPSPVLTMTLIMHDVACYLSRLKKLLAHKPRPREEKLVSYLNMGISLHKLVQDLNQIFETGDIQGNFAMDFYVSADPRRKSVAGSRKCSFTQLKKELDVHTRMRKDFKRSEGPWPPADIYIEVGDTPRLRPKAPASVKTAPPDTEALALTITQAVTGNMRRATHIHLLTRLLQAIDALESVPSRASKSPSAAAWCNLDLTALRRELDWTISSHADGILSDMRDALGLIDGEKPSPLTSQGISFRAYLMLWPLRTALKASQTSKETKEKIQRQLRYIDEVHGFGVAMKWLGMIPNRAEGEGVALDAVTR